MSLLPKNKTNKQTPKKHKLLHLLCTVCNPLACLPDPLRTVFFLLLPPLAKHPLKPLDDSVSWRHHACSWLPPLLTLISQPGMFFHNTLPPSQTHFLYLVNSYSPLPFKTQINCPLFCKAFLDASFGVNLPLSDPCMFLKYLLECFFFSALYFNYLQTFILTQQTFTEDSLYARRWGQRDEHDKFPAMWEPMV